MKSRYLHHPPDPRAFSSLSIWTEDGKMLCGLLAVLFKLKVIDLDTFRLT